MQSRQVAASMTAGWSRRTVAAAGGRSGEHPQSGRDDQYAPLPTEDNETEQHELEEYKRTVGELILESQVWQAVMGLLISLNALVIGLETDIPTFQFWDVVEHLFLAAFTVELALRLWVVGVRRFFAISNSEVWWNIFDCIVVGVGVGDTVLTVLLSVSTGSWATLFRMIRLLRMARLFRLLKYCKQLYLLAYGFVEAVQAIFWVTFLMSLILYVCAIVMVRSFGQLPDDDPHADFLHQHFADIKTSMLYLFVLMSSPNLPSYIAEGDLLWQRPLLLLFLVGFVVIGSFGMVALLTGVISENMFEKNQIRIEEERKEEEELIGKLESRASQIHAALPLSLEDKAWKEDIKSEALPKIAAMFEEAMVDFTKQDLEKMIEVMDRDLDGMIDEKEFCQCIATFAAGLKPTSFQEVHFTLAQCMFMLDGLDKKVAEIVHFIEAEGRRHKEKRAQGESKQGGVQFSIGVAPGSSGQPSEQEDSRAKAIAEQMANDEGGTKAEGTEVPIPGAPAAPKIESEGIIDRLAALEQSPPRQLVGEMPLEPFTDLENRLRDHMLADRRTLEAFIERSLAQHFARLREELTSASGSGGRPASSSFGGSGGGGDHGILGGSSASDDTTRASPLSNRNDHGLSPCFRKTDPPLSQLQEDENSPSYGLLGGDFGSAKSIEDRLLARWRRHFEIGYDAARWDTVPANMGSSRNIFAPTPSWSAASTPKAPSSWAGLGAYRSWASGHRR